MKITHVIWSLQYGGAETLLIQLLNLQSVSNEVSLIIVNDSIEDSLLHMLNENVHVIEINRKLGSKNPIPFIKLSFILLFDKSDIVHFHQDNLIEYIPIRIFKHNFCLTVHGIVMDKPSIHKYNYLFAVSGSVQKQIKKDCNLPSVLVYNGVSVNLFKKKTITKKENETFKIIQVGRLDHHCKGQDILIQAADLLVNQYKYSNFLIHLVGDGESRSYLQGLIDQLNLSAFVILEGSKSFQYIQEHVNTYDLLVQPSLHEGFGLVVIEAMASKVPVLTSDVDGLNEIIQDGKFGFCFKSKDIEGCAAKIWEIINMPIDKLTDLTEKSYNYVRENFDLSNTANAYIQAYQKILGRQ